MTAPHHLVEHALATSTSADCLVLVTASSSANLRWANNSLTTNGQMTSMSVTVIAFNADGGCASVSGSAATPDQVAALVAQADATVGGADPAEDRAPLITPRDSWDSDLWEAPPGLTSVEVYADLAPALGEEFDRAEAEQRILYGFVDHTVETTYLGSSTGLRLRHEQPTGHYGITGKPGDLSTSAWVGGATRDFTDVDIGQAVSELTRRIGWADRSLELPAGRYDTILPPTAVADLMIEAYWSTSARLADEGQTFFSRRGGGTRIGERIARPGVGLFSDPAYPGLECQPFTTASFSDETQSVFDNGLPLGRTDWIADGTLTALQQTRQTAASTGLPVTGSVDNLILDTGGSGSLDDLVAGTERGLLLTCLWYIRDVDPQTMLLTGLTRDGVYLVERGEVVGAVNNFRFNESPVDLLRRFTHSSETVPSFSREWGDDYFSRTATPALRIPDFTMSSVSPAR